MGFDNGGTFTAGQDVQGTINGEVATGVGRVLAGNAKNSTTDGLRLDVGLSPSQLLSGPDANVTYMRGFAARLSRSVDGAISRRTRGIQAEVDDLKKRIDGQQQRLALRRENCSNDSPPWKPHCPKFKPRAIS